MNKAKFSFILLLLLTYILSNAQQSDLWLINGKKVTISNYKIDTSDFYNKKILYTTIKGKTKSKYIDDVFSIVNENKKETVFYKRDDSIGYTLTQNQMRSYLYGLHDMHNIHISPLITLGGFASGMIATFIPMPQIYMFYLPVGILVPLAYVSVINYTPPSEIKLKNRLPEKANDDFYILGYQDGLRKKRIRNSLIGAGVGILAGFFITTTIIK